MGLKNIRKHYNMFKQVNTIQDNRHTEVAVRSHHGAPCSTDDGDEPGGKHRRSRTEEGDGGTDEQVQSPEQQQDARRQRHDDQLLLPGQQTQEGAS